MLHPHVERLEERVRQGPRERHGLVAEREEGVLHAVRELGEVGEAQRGRASLERMQAAGEVVEARFVSRLLQLDQMLGDAIDDLLRLVDESGEELLHHRIKHGASPMIGGPSGGADR